METTGDSYMMAAGLPGTAEEHAKSVTNMAFDMREIIEKKNITKESDIHADLEVRMFTRKKHPIPNSSHPQFVAIFGSLVPRPPRVFQCCMLKICNRHGLG